MKKQRQILRKQFGENILGNWLKNLNYWNRYMDQNTLTKFPKRFKKC